MKWLDNLTRLMARFRYPVSLPEDIGGALGIDTSNLDNFEALLTTLTSLKTTHLKKFMRREEAEEAFKKACIRERYGQNTLCCFYFNEGWIEFTLQFDPQSRLRRVYMMHKKIKNDVEIPILTP